jgi:hypothetical protein
MEAFAKQYGFRFVCHEKGHANRKAGEERSFWTCKTPLPPSPGVESTAGDLELFPHRPILSGGFEPLIYSRVSSQLCSINRNDSFGGKSWSVSSHSLLWMDRSINPGRRRAIHLSAVDKLAPPMLLFRVHCRA